ncbi:MAG TPA: hypothetical protein VFZ73_10630 [Gemmatimonadaceae bacterium]
MRFEALLRAHEFVQVQRPPEIWEADTEDVRFLPLLGEMLSTFVSRGVPLNQVTLLVSNMITADDPDSLHGLPGGEWVAVTVSGPADIGPDETWTPAAVPSQSTLGCLHERLTTAGTRFAYVRRLSPNASMTILLPRLHSR